MFTLALCSGCSRHVKRVDSACPFCGAPLEATDAPIAVVDEEAPRLSRSAMLLAGAAMVAGCNLTQTAAVYGGPPPRPVAQSDVPAFASIYGGPPQMFADAAVAPTPPPAPAYGLPPQPQPRPSDAPSPRKPPTP